MIADEEVQLSSAHWAGYEDEKEPARLVRLSPSILRLILTGSMLGIHCGPSFEL